MLNDPETLEEVIREICRYAMAGAHVSQPRIGVVFKRAGEVDRDGIGQKLVAQFGATRLLEQSALFGVEADYHYVLDSECTAHVWNRHSDPIAETELGQVPIGLDDLLAITGMLKPRNIVEFTIIKRRPRIVYEFVVNDGTLRAVVEVQRGRKWLVVRTAYKRK